MKNCQENIHSAIEFCLLVFQFTHISALSIDLDFDVKYINYISYKTQ